MRARARKRWPHICCELPITPGLIATLSARQVPARVPSSGAAVNTLQQLYEAWPGTVLHLI